MSKLHKLSQKAYDSNEDEKLALEAVIRNLDADENDAICFPIREKNGGKRWGHIVFTVKQLTQGLNGQHAGLIYLQGAFETDEAYFTRLESGPGNVNRTDLVERPTEKKSK